MKKDILKNVGQSFAIAVLAMATLILIGGSITLHARTIITGGWVIAISCGVAIIIVTAIVNLLIRDDADSKSLWIKYVGGVIISAAALAFSFYGLNYWCADSSTEHIERVEVVRKYYNVRHKTQRINRRVYTTGAPYKVYYIDVEFANGRIKAQSIPFSRYRRVHKGDTINLPMEKGLFGFPVIKE